MSDRGAGSGEREREQQDAHDRSGAHARDGVRRHEPEAHEQYPGGASRGDAYHRVAGRRERIGGGRHGETEHHDAGDRRSEAPPRIRDTEGDRGVAEQHGLKADRCPEWQHLVQRARLAGHDAVRLEDHEGQPDERRGAGDREQEPEAVDPLPRRGDGQCFVQSGFLYFSKPLLFR